ncbi:MAG: DUF3617 family protein [Proteobacteria bacterium]|nr:DUF3617 family protein [Pseudomonadota bacterium]
MASGHHNSPRGWDFRGRKNRVVALPAWTYLSGLTRGDPTVLLIIAAALMSTDMPAHLYEVTTETGMPHLEENLRYTTTREKVCLTHQSLTTAFPVLNYPALQGCRLQDELRQADIVSYTLVCAGGHGTTGQAVWHMEAKRITGTLNIKLGGKNMTFYQRVTAVSLGECPAGSV